MFSRNTGRKMVLISAGVLTLLVIINLILGRM
jgi:hypothetical protein